MRYACRIRSFCSDTGVSLSPSFRNTMGAYLPYPTAPFLSQKRTAGDFHGFPHDIDRRIRQQERDRMGHFFGFRNLPGRNPFVYLFPALLQADSSCRCRCTDHVMPHRRIHITGTDCIHADVVGNGLQRKRMGKPDQGEFGGAVRCCSRFTNASRFSMFIHATPFLRANEAVSLPRSIRRSKRFFRVNSHP